MKYNKWEHESKRFQCIYKLQELSFIITTSVKEEDNSESNAQQ
jgi:hypothetical protein